MVYVRHSLFPWGHNYLCTKITIPVRQVYFYIWVKKKTNAWEFIRKWNKMTFRAFSGDLLDLIQHNDFFKYRNQQHGTKTEYSSSCTYIYLAEHFFKKKTWQNDKWMKKYIHRAYSPGMLIIECIHVCIPHQMCSALLIKEWKRAVPLPI